METEIVWGEPIAVDYPNKPDWLADDQDITVRWSTSDDAWLSLTYSGHKWSNFSFAPFTHIKLPADHPYYAATGIDWTKPIEHVDGTPLAFKEGCPAPDHAGDYSLVREDGEDFTPEQHDHGILIVRSNGVDWLEGPSGKPKVRNRTTADKLGDPIEVNGVRPEWLGDDELILPQETDEVDWEEPLEAVECRVWEMISTIRLPRYHPAYTALAAGFTPWGGGDSAPDDWDGGEVLFRDGGAGSIFRESQCWNHDDPSPSDIIGYHKRVEVGTLWPEYRPVESAAYALNDPTLDTVTVKRMTEDEVRADADENEGFDRTWVDEVVAFAQRHGIITPTTPLAQFIAANPGVVNDENRAAVELALNYNK